MEAVDVLVRANTLEQQRGVEVSRQRQLQENTVDGRVIVQAIDQIGEGLLRGLAGQVEGLGDETDFFAVLAFVRDIDLRSRVGADQDHSQAWRAQALLATLHDTLSNLLAQVGGDRLAVDKVCSHRRVINHREENKRGVHSLTTQREGKGGWSGKCPKPLNKMNFFEKSVDGLSARH
ncbi:hypothetical protein PS627_04570 [Pseudomonas fluorescens]|nr:hypothetical protein PS627_04570 [Pseudomonas fluorescens]